MEQADLIHRYIVYRAGEKQEQLEAPNWWVDFKRWLFGKLIALAG
jgi:hypothetical protein